ncbi:hypothetical protein O1R50_18835 [Glycomyces luteolus]|uniref:Uncharacterized protein n=1 Tax=Glycomyces luteolus TaxID=2670330 RepID=A0A9X3SRR3_9ACTN|nr:hypothetical protein [Glycomyces luteolus]MDA1361691.1 hypothetical protein [Glycomyces luteolus]
MPTFQQCLDADPRQLRALGEATREAVAEVRQLGLDYGRTVLELSPPWHGADYLALIDRAEQVTAYLRRSDHAWSACAHTMETGGDRMARAVDAMKALKHDAEHAGYRVTPAPAVRLGPNQIARLTAGGPHLLRAYLTGAAAYEHALAALYTEVVAEDAIANAAVRTALSLDEPQGDQTRQVGPERRHALERRYELTCGALEAAGIPLWNRPENRDHGGAHVEMDTIDDGGSGVFATWMIPGYETVLAEPESLAERFEEAMSRMRTALLRAGITAEETDPDDNPYTLEVLSVRSDLTRP